MRARWLVRALAFQGGFPSAISIIQHPMLHMSHGLPENIGNG